jgi:hypothetical protein
MHANRKFTSDIMNDIAAIIKKNGIHKSTKYAEFREKHGNVYMGVKMPRNPWLIANQTVKEFFAYIHGEELQAPSTPHYNYKKIDRPTLEEHMELARKHNLLTAKDYRKFVSASKLENKFFNCPWIVFKLSITDFLRRAIPSHDKIMSKKKMRICQTSNFEHVAICIEKNLTNSQKWRTYYLTNRDSRDILARPWDRFGMSEAKFFKAIRKQELQVFLNKD